MKQINLPLLTVLFLITSFASAQVIPNYMTEEEKSVYKTYIPPAFGAQDINPPTSPARTHAEWEELQALIITWTSYPQILAQIVDYAQEECKVFIVCSDSNSVKTSLTSYGVPLVNIRYVIASFNTIWCRDYGPWCIYTNIADSLRIADWIYNRPRPQDDLIPGVIANLINVPIHYMTNSPNDLTATGGNFMCDGNGTGFSSRLILNENPAKTEAQIDTILKKYMGINRYALMNTLPYDQIHHIDMHMKLLDEETILVGQYPVGVADGPQIELNLQYILANYQTCYGKPYKVVRIPMPPNSSGQYPPTADYFTYTNSSFVNKTILVPIYGLSQDTTALRIYRESCPGYKVYGINCSSIIPSLGAIHCITKEVGVYEPVFISHSAIRSATTLLLSYEVKAYIKSKSGISNAKCFWTTDTTAGFTPIIMAAVADTFKAYIPAKPEGTKIYYYISATSVSGRTVTKPLPAPSGNFRFTVTLQSGISNGNSAVKEYKLFQNYPNPFNPTTNIKYQIANTKFVSLKVFDILGREVATLVNEIQKPGLYEIPFSVNQFSKNRLSSGIYFYKLVSGEFTDIKRMIIAK
jgi:agmatine/peptidylarginine deiminase